MPNDPIINSNSETVDYEAANLDNNLSEKITLSTSDESTINANFDLPNAYYNSQAIKTDLSASIKKEVERLKKVGLAFSSLDEIEAKNY